MKYIFLIAVFNALFFSVLILQKKPRAYHDNILIIWLVYLSVFISAYAIPPHGLLHNHTLLASFLIPPFMLHGPFLYLYSSSLTREKVKLSRIELFHFIPFLLFMLYLLIAAIIPGYSAGITLEHRYSEDPLPALFIVFLLFSALSGPAYFAITILQLRKHGFTVFNNFSFSNDIDLGWLKKISYLFGFIWTALIIVAVIHHILHLFSMDFCLNGLFLSLSVFVILIGYFGLKQKEIFIHYPGIEKDLKTEPKMKYTGSGLREADAKNHVSRLRIFMQSEKPYMDAELSLHKLAGDLKIPASHLSRIINENFGLNFFDFINQYRVEEIKSRLNDPGFKNYSLLGIAFECGFNSKSAFNRIFKKMTGVTPSDYKRSEKGKRQ